MLVAQNEDSNTGQRRNLDESRQSRDMSWKVYSRQWHTQAYMLWGHLHNSPYQNTLNCMFAAARSAHGLRERFRKKLLPEYTRRRELQCPRNDVTQQRRLRFSHKQIKQYFYFCQTVFLPLFCVCPCTFWIPEVLIRTLADPSEQDSEQERARTCSEAMKDLMSRHEVPVFFFCFSQAMCRLVVSHRAMYRAWCSQATSDVHSNVIYIFILHSNIIYTCIWHHIIYIYIWHEALNLRRMSICLFIIHIYMCTFGRWSLMLLLCTWLEALNIYMYI